MRYLPAITNSVENIFSSIDAKMEKLIEGAQSSYNAFDRKTDVIYEKADLFIESLAESAEETAVKRFGFLAAALSFLLLVEIAVFISLLQS